MPIPYDPLVSPFAQKWIDILVYVRNIEDKKVRKKFLNLMGNDIAAFKRGEHLLQYLYEAVEK